MKKQLPFLPSKHILCSAEETKNTDLEQVELGENNTKVFENKINKLALFFLTKIKMKTENLKNKSKS